MGLVEVPLNPHEQAGLLASARAIREAIDAVS